MSSKQEDINQLAAEKGLPIGFCPDIKGALQDGHVLICISGFALTIMLMLCPTKEHYHVVYLHDNDTIVLDPKTYSEAIYSCLLINSDMDSDAVDVMFRDRFVAVPEKDFDAFMEIKTSELASKRFMKSFIEAMIGAL